MRAIPAIAAEFVARHEALRLAAYQDSGGVWTIGYGHTGPGVHAGLRITGAQAKGLLDDDLRIAAGHLAVVVKADVLGALTDHQYAALLSFVFNLGCDRKWTVWRRLNAEAFDQVPLELAKFVNGTVEGRKVKIRGLVSRRAAEIALWSTEEPGSISDTPPSSETRNMATPPTPADPTPPAKSATILALASGAVTAAPGAVKQVTDAISPYADRSDHVQQLVAFLATLSAGLVILGLALAWITKKRARA